MSDKLRRKKEPKHVRIYQRAMKSAAWADLTGSAVKVLLALASLDNGERNGALCLSARQGSELTGLGKDAVNRALNELIGHGFIYCSQPGSFDRKVRHAATYGLTWVAGQPGSKHRAPSHSYESWQPAKKHGPERPDRTVPKIGTATVPQSVDGPENRDRAAAESAEKRQSDLSRKSGHIVISHRHSASEHAAARAGTDFAP